MYLPPREFLRRSKSLLAPVAALTFVTFAMKEVWALREVTLATKYILTGCWLVLAIEVMYERLRFTKAMESADQTARDAERQRLDYEAQLEELNHDLTERGLLLKYALSQAADILDDVIEDLQRSAIGLPPQHSKGRIINRVLKRLCHVFEGDRRASGEERLESTFFKATYFELQCEREIGILRRIGSHYPPTRVPRTEHIIPNEHPTACAVICMRLEKLIVVTDIATERTQEHSRWSDLRDNQWQDYASMFSAPVMWRSQPGEETRHFAGVITVDTNRWSYFKDSPEDREFLSTIVTPFVKLICLSYSVYEKSSLSPK